MGTKVDQIERALGLIKAAAASAASVPALRDQVELLIDEVQKIKDALVDSGQLEDD